MATEATLDSLEYYSEYVREEGEIELRSYLLDYQNLAGHVASGLYPSLLVLSDLQRSQGQGPRDPSSTDEPPFPPRRLKREIFDPAKYAAMDEYVSSLLPEPRESDGEFARRLFKMCASNLDKARAGFYFVCTASVDRLEQVDGESDAYTTVRNLRKPGGATSAFQTLMKLAGVPTKAITGYKKGTSYELGFEVPHDGGCWFACYVEGEWRFIDALWGSQCVTGFDKGNFIKLDASGNLEGVHQSDGTDVYQCNELYFLTDPVVFAVNHLPNDHLSEWQLLARTLTIAEFSRLPKYFPGSAGDISYKYKVVPKSNPLNVILGAPGAVQISLTETGDESYEYKTEIHVHTKSINEETRAAIKQRVDLNRYLSKMTRMSSKEVKLKFVPPCRGKFMLTISVMRTERIEETDRIVLVTTTVEFLSYIIHCPQAVNNAKTLPEGSAKLMGFGAGRALAQAGLKTDNPGEMIAVNGELKLEIDSLDGRHHPVQCVLTGSDNKPLPSNHALSWHQGSKTGIVFLSPDPGSYALVVQEDGKPVCQFLIEAPSEFRDSRLFRLPDLQKLGGLGVNYPGLGDEIEPVSHPEPYVLCEEENLELAFSTKRRVEVKAELFYVDSDGHDIAREGYTYLHSSAGGFTVQIRFQMPGHYVVKLDARYEGSGTWRHYTNYFVRALGHLDGSAGQFPETGEAWRNSFKLIQPTCKLLPVNKPVDFALEISDPKFKAIWLVNEFTGERSAMSVDEVGLWQGTITGTSEAAGAAVKVIGGADKDGHLELLKYRFETVNDRRDRKQSMRRASALNKQREIIERSRRHRQENFDRAERALELLPEEPIEDLLAEAQKLGEADISSEDEIEVEPEQELKRQVLAKEAQPVKELEVEMKEATPEESETAPSLSPTKLAERAALAGWLNKALASDPECRGYLPFQQDGSDLCSKCRDGLVPCKLINVVCPGTIDERVLIRGANLSQADRLQNLTLALNSAQSLGVPTSADASQLAASGSDEMMLDLLLQVIRQGLLAKVKQAASGSSELRSLPAEQILLQWVNAQLECAGSQRRIGNLSDDIKDSEVYANLLGQIAGKESKGVPYQLHDILQPSDALSRACLLLRNADKLGVADFVDPPTIAIGNSHLNVAFVASLYCKFATPAATPPAPHDSLSLARRGSSTSVRLADRRSLPTDRFREETTYINWINSMGIEPRVTSLYDDLRSGLVYFKLCDLIKPGIVRWPRVHQTFHRLRESFERLENCNYALELGRELGFSLVGIGGEDLVAGHEVLTLGLLWQLMRAYTLAVLSKLASAASAGSAGTSARIDEKSIIQWVNQKLQSGRKSSRLNSFQDPGISDAKCVLELIDCLRPGAVDSANVLAGVDETEKLQNAKLAISLGWRIGAKIYALPEDIVEVKPKMVMTIFACLMQLHYELK